MEHGFEGLRNDDGTNNAYGELNDGVEWTKEENIVFIIMEQNCYHGTI